MSELSINRSLTTPSTDTSNLIKNNLITESIVNYVNKMKSNSYTRMDSDPGSPVISSDTTKYESLIDKINNKIATNQHWFSLEFFPPKTINGAANLIQK